MSSINIAVKVNGGFGTILVRANYLHCLYTYINDKDIKIYAYGHKNPAVNDAIFKGIPSIFYYATEQEWDHINHKDFDLVFILDLYPDLIYQSSSLIHKNQRLQNLTNTWRTFKADGDNKLYFSNLRKSKPYAYTQLIIERKTILNSADIGNILGIQADYTIPIIIEQQREKVLSKFHLLGKKFITFQRGINPKLSANETPKLWPIKYYEELLALLKRYYPDYTLVQLGESAEHCKSVTGTDMNLLGQTSWDDIKVLLKEATLHIDGECGMVHPRKALHAGPSVVLFGPTPMELFGYEGNINIRGTGCKHWCAELCEDWEYHCPRNVSEPPCMYSISPEMVFNKINAWFREKTLIPVLPPPDACGNKTPEIIKKFGKRLDQSYVRDWLKEEIYFDYEKVNIPVSSLFCTVFDGVHWTTLPVDETPAYQYLIGNPKPFIENAELREQNLPDNTHSLSKYLQLIEKINVEGFHQDTLILVSCKNVIKDGQHRAALWMYKYGKDALIPALKLYKDEQ